MLSTGKLPPGGLPRNSVVRITDRPDPTVDVKQQIKKKETHMSLVIKMSVQLTTNGSKTFETVSLIAHFYIHVHGMRASPI